MTKPACRLLLGSLALCLAASSARADDAVRIIPPGFPDVVVFGERTVDLKNQTHVISGNVVANTAVSARGAAELSVGPKAVIQAGSLSGDSVRVKSQTLVQGDVRFNDLVNQGTITGAQISPQVLPVFDPLPPFETGTPGLADVVVPNDQTVNLGAGAYARLDVGKGATVYFTGGTYDFASIATQKDARLLFDAPAKVHVAGSLATGTDAVVGPSSGKAELAAEIVFYVAGEDGALQVRSSSKAAVLGVRTQAAANFYVAFGTLDLQQGCVATGAFLARDLEAGPKATLTLASAFFNRPPVAADDFATVTTGGTVEVLNSGATSVLANDGDPDGDALVVTTTPVSGPASGALVLNADGTFSYTHDGGESTSDSFIYEACDPGFPVLCATATVSIAIEPPPFTVTIEKAGTGSGTVSSTPSGIDCGPTCSATFPAFVQVALSASADPGSVFVGWSGSSGCAAALVTGPPDATCVATFNTFVPVTLTVVKDGEGSGHVGSAPAGIDCGPVCSADFPALTRVQLQPTADKGSVFSGFGGDPDCDDGEVAMNVAKTCTASFGVEAPPPGGVQLTIQKLGAGSGHVGSSPAGIDCGPICTGSFPSTVRVDLSVLADPGSVFSGFGGDPDCEDGEVLLSVATTCTATFDLLPPAPASSTLTVLRQGSGTGIFTSTPPGIDCDFLCEAVFEDGTEVTLVATPDPGSVFVGWGGDCSGNSPSTTVVMGPDKICFGSYAAQ